MTAHKSNAEKIREVMHRSASPLSIADIFSALSSNLNHAQVKTAVNQMAKDKTVEKCGDRKRQLFRLARKPAAMRFNVTIEPARFVTDTKPKSCAETAEEWMLRTGRKIEKLPIGASVRPLKRIGR